MTHPYRENPTPKIVRWRPGFGHILRRRFLRLLMRFKGSFINRNPWPCPQCGLRGFTWLEKRAACCPAHGSALAVASNNDGVHFEWTVWHQCCHIRRDPKPAIPPGYVPQKWRGSFGPSTMPVEVSKSLTKLFNKSV